MLKVALAQLNSNDDIQSNLNSIIKLIDEAVASPNKPKLILFPENSLYFRISAEDQVKAIKKNSTIWSELQSKANLAGISLHLTTAIMDQDNKIYNASILIQPAIPLKITYRKIHLFDIELVGQKPIRESDVFSNGDLPSVFEFQGIKFGSSICYDLRFSELYLAYAKQEVDVILVPSAFLVTTGLAHWESLLRARAIESQCYVLAAAQSGEHLSHQGGYAGQSRKTYGHTLAIGPWGQIVQEKAEGVGLVYLELDKSEIALVRAQIPMKSHRRL
ncbi:MAG: nitrilase-related carbon-nitrogen hydrolase [Pseudobdellovibrio sp.]